MRRFGCVFLFFLAGALFAAGQIRWSKAREVRPGVLWLKIERKTPRLQKINAMRIDLGNRKLRFAATPRDADYGKPMPDYPSLAIQTKRMRTADFVAGLQKEKRNVLVAANAAPWSPWTDPYTHLYGKLPGLNIADGEIVSDDGRHGAVFLVRKNGKAEIRTERVPESEYSDLQIAVSGFFPIVRQGKVVEREAPPDPRMAYGLSRDGRYLYLVTVDGRQKNWSDGATINELGQLMIDAGAFDALNMDGGGSTTLLYVGGRKKAIVVNRHSESGYTRPVASNIAIWLEK